MVRFEVRFDDGEHYASAPTLKEAQEIRNENNFKFLSRSLYIYMVTTYGGWREQRIV